jgi:hypothetical protein
MIPKVRRWKVTARDANDKLVGVVYVDTINKRFARWLATEKLLPVLGAHAWVNRVDRLTVSLDRKAT